MSLRPPLEERKELATIAKELRKSQPQVVSDFLTDCLEMLRTEHFGVPPTVNMIRVLRAAKATLASPAVHPEMRDKREVALYGTPNQGGQTTGVIDDLTPTMIPIPPDWTLPVDFVTPVDGHSMTGVVEDGEFAAFIRADRAKPGQIVTAIVDGQAMLKMFTPAALLSVNPDKKSYPPIPVTPEVRIQGIYQGKFPVPSRFARRRA